MQNAFYANAIIRTFDNHQLPRRDRSAHVTSVLSSQVAVQFEDSQRPLHIPAAGPQEPQEETLTGESFIHLATDKVIGFSFVKLSLYLSRSLSSAIAVLNFSMILSLKFI